MTKEQLQSEIRYHMALAFLDSLLSRGLLTEEEYELADRLNAESLLSDSCPNI